MTPKNTGPYGHAEPEPMKTARWPDQIVRDLSACRREQLALVRDREDIAAALAQNHVRAEDNRKVHAALTAELYAIIEEGAHA